MTHWRMQLNNLLHRLPIDRNALHWVDEATGPRYSPTWTSKVEINDVQYGIGHGPSKDASREQAAEQAYNALAAEYDTK